MPRGPAGGRRLTARADALDRAVADHATAVKTGIPASWRADYIGAEADDLGWLIDPAEREEERAAFYAAYPSAAAILGPGGMLVTEDGAGPIAGRPRPGGWQSSAWTTAPTSLSAGCRHLRAGDPAPTVAVVDTRPQRDASSASCTSTTRPPMPVSRRKRCTTLPAFLAASTGPPEVRMVIRTASVLAVDTSGSQWLMHSTRSRRWAGSSWGTSVATRTTCSAIGAVTRERSGCLASLYSARSSGGG